jgi:hypothetical protein
MDAKGICSSDLQVYAMFVSLPEGIANYMLSDYSWYPAGEEDEGCKNTFKLSDNEAFLKSMLSNLGGKSERKLWLLNEEE